MPTKPKQSAQGFWYKSNVTPKYRELLVANSKEDFRLKHFDKYQEDARGNFTYFKQGRKEGDKLTQADNLFDPSTHKATTEKISTLFHRSDFVDFEATINDVKGVLPAHVFTKSGKHIGHIGKLGNNSHNVYLLDTDENILRTDPDPNSLKIYLKKLSVDYNTLIKLAGVVYAESGAHDNVKEEKFAIASACLNYQNAGTTHRFSKTLSDISYATHDGNPRFTNLTNASTRRNQNSEMTLSIMAAINALTGGVDYSNGATGWDGPDLRTNSHSVGFHMKPEHDIFGLGDRPAKVGDNTQYYYRESTAAYGRTVFYKISEVHISNHGRAY